MQSLGNEVGQLAVGNAIPLHTFSQHVLNDSEDVTRLCEQSALVTDDAGLGVLKATGQLDGATSLKLSGITDAGLQHLQGLTSLQKLDLSGTQVTDEGLDYIKGLRSLQEVNLAGTRVSAQGLWKLKWLPLDIIIG